jgi:hypothetical protein
VGAPFVVHGVRRGECRSRPAAHPAVYAYRNWRGQVVSHRHVDVNTIVEIETAQGPFPLAHVIRDADVRDVVELTAELRRVKTNSAGRDGGRSTRALVAGTRIPGVLPVLYAVMVGRCGPGNGSAPWP